MSKVNTTVKIVASSEDLAKALFGYLKSSNSQIKQNLDNFLRSSGKGLTDVTFESSDPEKMVFRISDNPVDKGSVIVLDEGSLAMSPYSGLNSEELYGYLEGNNGVVYKYNEGKVDTPIHAFRSFSELESLFLELPKMIEEHNKSQEAAIDKAVELKKAEVEDPSDENDSMEATDAEPVMEVSK